MNKNAPFIREIIDRTKSIGGVRIQGKNKEELERNFKAILNQQMKDARQYDRTQKY